MFCFLYSFYLFSAVNMSVSYSFLFSFLIFHYVLLALIYLIMSLYCKLQCCALFWRCDKAKVKSKFIKHHKNYTRSTGTEALEKWWHWYLRIILCSAFSWLALEIEYIEGSNVFVWHYYAGIIDIPMAEDMVGNRYRVSFVAAFCFFTFLQTWQLLFVTQRVYCCCKCSGFKLEHLKQLKSYCR